VLHRRPRVLFAAETQTAWLERSAIALLGFGSIVANGSAVPTPWLAQSAESGSHAHFSIALGVMLLLLGAAVA